MIIGDRETKMRRNPWESSTLSAAADAENTCGEAKQGHGGWLRNHADDVADFRAVFDLIPRRINLMAIKIRGIRFERQIARYQKRSYRW